MKLGKLVLLAGAALAANALINRTEKGRQFKKNVADNAGKLTDKVKEAVNRRRSSMDDSLSDLTGNPGGSPM